VHSGCQRREKAGILPGALQKLKTALALIATARRSPSSPKLRSSMIAATRDPSSRQGNLLMGGQQLPEPAEGAHYDNIDEQCSLLVSRLRMC